MSIPGEAGRCVREKVCGRRRCALILLSFAPLHIFMGRWMAKTIGSSHPACRPTMRLVSPSRLSLQLPPTSFPVLLRSALSRPRSAWAELRKQDHASLIMVTSSLTHPSRTDSSRPRPPPHGSRRRNPYPQHPRRSRSTPAR